MNRMIRILFLSVLAVFLGSLSSPVHAQTDNSPFPSLQTEPQTKAPPLTNQEFVRMLYQLPANPSMRERLVQDLRTRGINFQVTEGLRSLVATKSGNDSLLRHTLEEAERRRANPTSTTARLPSMAEATELLERTRKATLGAAFGAGLSRTLLATYLPAFFAAGALCIIAALIVLAISRQPKPVAA